MNHSKGGLSVCALSVSLLLGCGANDTPTSPSKLDHLRSSADTLAGQSRGQSQTVSITGRLTNAVTGEPVGGSFVRIPSVATTETGADGIFNLNLEQSGQLPLIIEGDGHYPRETHLLTTSSNQILTSAIPTEGRFDLDFFDHVFRDLGESGTIRWTYEPEFEIWMQVYDCEEMGSNGFCTEFLATAQPLPPPVLETVKGVITNDMSKFTGGVLNGSNITMVHHEPGTILTQDDMIQGGKITFALTILPHGTSWAWPWRYDSGHMYGGHIQINKHHKKLRGVISHELAHNLGYFHPRGGHYVPLKSIMRYGDFTDPTLNDILHGKILYSRPPGSRTPDKDPADYVVNAQTTLSPSGGLRGTLTQ
jgi:hypothetical protein